MATLNFKGKAFVQSHYLAVPFQKNGKSCLPSLSIISLSFELFLRTSGRLELTKYSANKD